MKKLFVILAVIYTITNLSICIANADVKGNKTENKFIESTKEATDKTVEATKKRI